LLNIVKSDKIRELIIAQGFYRMFERGPQGSPKIVSIFGVEE